MAVLICDTVMVGRVSFRGGRGGGIRPPLESLCPPLAFSHSLLYSTVK